MHGISEARYMPAVLARIAEYHKDATRFLATGIHISVCMRVWHSVALGVYMIPNCWAGDIVFMYLELFGSCMPSYC